MRVSSETALRTRAQRTHGRTSDRRWQFFILLLTLGGLAAFPAWADGCFVFKWNKAIDINEPTQKAIIVYDAGREDLLLQVKYEGPLEEFGWLIPVPSLPKVEKGSMEPFYELSQLTQRQLGLDSRGATLGGKGGYEESVRVIEIKTVGAYEVAILSARDSESLKSWLLVHDYTVPEDKSEIVDDYVRRGWYFIAAKIELNKGVGFKAVTSATPRDADAGTKAREVLQKQLSSGELHPLLISFETPRCVFPLKISAVGGKPSEVSVYVLANEPLLDSNIFNERCKRLRGQRQKWDQDRQQNGAQRQVAMQKAMQNTRSLQLAWHMYTLMPRGTNGRPVRDWVLEDLVAMGKEGQPAINWDQADLDDKYYAPVHDLLSLLQVKSGQLPQCSKAMPRITNRDWFLTKLVRTFKPNEMRDLEFEPAIPVLAQTLKQPEGEVAARMLSTCGPGAVPVLIAACQSSSLTERINASAVAGWPQDARYVAPLLELLRDAEPKIRLNAFNGVALNWNPCFTEPLISLLRDQNQQIRSGATQCLRAHDRSNPRVYLQLLKDDDPDVQASALQILSMSNSAAIPRTELVRLLGAPRMQTVSLALVILGAGESPLNPRPMPSPFSGPIESKVQLASEEAAPLTTNGITLARLTGLKILNRNADAKAVDLILPLLNDPNAIVRSRAFAALSSITYQNISDSDPAKWEAWWAKNKTSFTQRRATP